MIKTMILSAAAAAVLAVLPLSAQDTAKTALQAARKQAGQATGKVGEPRTAELKKAIDMYRVVLEKWPADQEACAEAHFRTAELANQCGDKKAALESADKAIALESGAAVRGDALLLKAAILRKDKNYDGARAALQRVVEECAQDESAAAEALLDLASIARQQKKWSDQASAAQAVLDKYPGRWRDGVEACDLIVGSLVRTHEWVKAQKKIEELDRLLTERFKNHAKWPSVEKAMKAMVSRRALTTVDEDEKD